MYKCDVFIIVDESDVRDAKFLNILCADIKLPEKIYLLCCINIESSPNAEVVCQRIDDTMREFEIQKSSVKLLISDAAPYMIKAGRLLKPLYACMFHVTCIAHLLHNCALQIRSSYPDVNSLIATIKNSIVKNKTRKMLFEEIGCPPDVIVTRWGSWLHAAFYYADHLPQVRAIVSSFEEDGKIVRNAKEAIESQSLAHNLMVIKTEYAPLLNLINRCEFRGYSIIQAFKDMNELDFGNDSCHLKDYISKSLAKNQLEEIVEMKDIQESPSIYGLLHQCPASSAEVERSFSMLKKLLAKDRNFNSNNIEKYFFYMFNKI